MKRFLSLILMLCMLVTLTPCFAEMSDNAEVTIDKTNESKAEVNRSSIEFTDTPANKENTPIEVETKSVSTQDAVTITAGDDSTISYRVATSHGVILNYTSGNAIALTQDLLQQADWFVSFFSNPRAVVENWIERNMHLNIYDFNTKTDIYVHVRPSALSMIYSDSRELSKEDANDILNAMKGKKNYFEGASEASVGWLGDNVWFLADMRNVDGTVTLVCFVGGVEIYCYANVSNDEQYNALIAEIEKLQIIAG